MKISYNGIIFDSELEVTFYQMLEQETLLKNGAINFLYQTTYKHTPIHINLGRRKNYTPDFIIIDDINSIIYIIETKGYAKWSANEDNNIMDFMQNKVIYDTKFLRNWLEDVFFDTMFIDVKKAQEYEIKYHRLKHLKGVGFVDYNYKNPNSISNKRKLKIEEQTIEIKELKSFQKDTLRYFGYLKKEKNNQKLTRSQLEWFENFENEVFKLLEKKEDK